MNEQRSTLLGRAKLATDDASPSHSRRRERTSGCPPGGGGSDIIRFARAGERPATARFDGTKERKDEVAEGEGARARPPVRLRPGAAARLAERFRVTALDHRAGRLAAAEAGYREILEAAPGYPGAALNYALLARSTGRVDLALGLAEEAVASEPFEAIAHATLGNLLLEKERTAESVDAYSAALRFDPGHVNARFNLGYALRRLGEPEAAADEFNRLVDRLPNDAGNWIGLGGALLEAARPRDALDALKRALVLSPNDPEVLTELGIAHVDAGEFEAARGCYRRVIAARPDDGRAWLNYAKTRRFDAATDGTEIEEAERAAARLDAAPEPGVECGDLHFALGKMHDDLGDYDRAFEHFRRGNEILRRHTPHDPGAAERLAAEMEARYDASWFEGVRGEGEPSPRPVFIVGMPRSGTTLVEQILASHPAVHGAGELIRLPNIARRLLGRGGGGDRARGDHGAEARPPAKADLEAAARDYLEYIGARAGAALRVTDKLPENYHHLGLIASILPNARIVHVRRDPMDVCVSNYVVRFGQGHAWSFGFESLPAEYHAYERLMRHWRAVLPSPMHEISYERLTESLEAESRRLVGFCGLDWDPGCLEFHRTERAVHTASGWQVRQPVYRRSVGRWRNYERHLEPLHTALESRGISVP